LSRSPVLDPELEPVSEPKTAPAVEFAPKLVSPTGPGTFSTALWSSCFLFLHVSDCCRRRMSR
jgi:hypothetical protein